MPQGRHVKNIFVHVNKYECDDQMANEINNMSQSNSIIDNKTYLVAEIKEEKNIKVKHNNDKPVIKLSIKDKVLEFLVDSGSDRTIISEERLINVSPESKIDPSNIVVRGINGRSNITGETELTLNIQSQCITTKACLLYTSPSPRDKRQSRMPSSA